jgi:4-nitrophenyl phosphatase
LTKNPGCHFILTNTDATFPSGGEFYPGSGAMSAPLVYSTKMTPTVIGKPNSHMMDAILASKDFDRSRTIMVGDNLETDILFGQNSGIETLLTMTGEKAIRSVYNVGGELWADLSMLWLLQE